MSFADVREPDKVGSSVGSQAGGLVGMALQIGEMVERAAREETSLRQFERQLLDRLLSMGHAATEQFLALQGDGDSGETVTDEDGRTLFRSDEPAQRPLRTVFGQHQFAAYVYRLRPHPHTPISVHGFFVVHGIAGLTVTLPHKVLP